MNTFVLIWTIKIFPGTKQGIYNNKNIGIFISQIVIFNMGTGPEF